ncbi:hypothetical protein UY3_05330 [Chelonia mydas]|uniref:Uncharacterized protein n=1 Tax=Chelonia mydas TaxID=8469 RepID=M7CA54_CHEMY|nr:hypothetical protein UY3_05330 [Chelonia mydas]
MLCEKPENETLLSNLPLRVTLPDLIVQEPLHQNNDQLDCDSHVSKPSSCKQSHGSQRMTYVSEGCQIGSTDCLQNSGSGYTTELAAVLVVQTLQADGSEISITLITPAPVSCGSYVSGRSSPANIVLSALVLGSVLGLFTPLSDTAYTDGSDHSEIILRKKLGERRLIRTYGASYTELHTLRSIGARWGGHTSEVLRTLQDWAPKQLKIYMENC